MNNPLLNDVFPEWVSGGGVFSLLEAEDIYPAPPWLLKKESLHLDLEYHGNHAGGKYVSPLVNSLIQDGVISEMNKKLLAGTILSIFYDNWQKQWDTLTFQYDPIQNYSMTEEMTDDKTVTEYGRTQTRTDDLTHAKTGTETENPNLTDTTTPNLTSSTLNKVYGFNSNVGVPTGEQSQTDSGNQTSTRTGNMETVYNVSDKDSGTQTTADGGTDTQTHSYTFKRSGNIGVTTSQQMITSERELWVWNFFRDVVFPDIDTVLTLQIY